MATQKGQPAPAAPAPGKAQIVFIEEMDNADGKCLHCDATTRFGMDGAWVGANHGNSYFTLAADPGEHHLCVDWQSVFGRLKQKIGLASFTAEPGRVYYFQAKVTVKEISKEYTETVDCEAAWSPNTGGRTTGSKYSILRSEDDTGKYRVKA